MYCPRKPDSSLCVLETPSNCLVYLWIVEEVFWNYNLESDWFGDFENYLIQDPQL